MKSLIFILVLISFAFALNKPTNYVALNGASRGDQQQVNGFAAWNATSNNWKVVLPHGIPKSSVNGMVRVGTGLLVYGSFTTLGNGANAAGLAYYNGVDWCAPEGVGLYGYTATNTQTRFENVPTPSSAFAATVVGTDVYLLGEFNQVGLVRGGVAGFVKLSWSAGGVFTIGTVGDGYSQTVDGVCSSFCPQTTQPAAGTKNKLWSYTNSAGVLTFIFQNSGNLYKFQPNGQQWDTITTGSGARNLGANINDFAIFGTTIYAVGNFDNTNDVSATNRYLHIAQTTDDGVTWTTTTGLASLDPNSFACLGAVVNATTGTIIYPGVSCSGLSAVFVESAQSIYVAGGWRVVERDSSIDNLAGQLQTRVFQITATSVTPLSERFATTPATLDPTVERITQLNGVLYVFGNFNVYRQTGTNGIRYGRRFTFVTKGAAQFVNGTWGQAFGGYLTTGYPNDVSPNGLSVVTSTDSFYFVSNTNSDDITSTYRLVSGGLFAYGGDKKNNENNRWNSVLSNQRFVSSQSYQSGVGQEGQVNALHVTKSGDALIFGGLFDWIGSQAMGGVGWYNPDNKVVYQVGGGLYQVTSSVSYGSDTFYNNRMGGNVYDFEERGEWLFAGGLFNRNNSGSCLSNVAMIKFRQAGAGWETLDGGCDAIVRDLLVVGDLLYATGDFKFCGLVTDSYTGNLVRGRVPTNRIAVIDLSEGSKASWRNLGVGLNGVGRALAWRGSDLFVGGSFTIAGGKQYTRGIARWRGDHWEDVVGKCRGSCDRPQSVYSYSDPTTFAPNPTARLPTNGCSRLSSFNGLIYCFDTSASRVAIFDSNTWNRGGDFAVAVSGVSNSFFSRNATNNNHVLVASGTTDIGSNSANLYTFDESDYNFVPTYGGFSQSTYAVAASSSLFVSQILILSFVFLFVTYFF